MNIHSTKIIFIGMNELGEKCLSKLIENKLNIVQVIVPKENRLKTIESICRRKKINYYQIKNSLEEIKRIIFKTKLDLLIIASFPQLISEEVINYPSLGSINVHPSLLPKLRGSHPLNWALIRDEKETGVTIHYLDKGMDTGDIIAQKSISITNYDNIQSIKKKLFTFATKLLLKSVKKIIKLNGKIPRIKQNHQEKSFALKRRPEDGIIDWNKNTRDIFNLIRALEFPYNASSYTRSGKKVEFEKTYLSKKPGKVIGKINGYYLITVGDGCILTKTKSKLKIGEELDSNFI